MSFQSVLLRVGTYDHPHNGTLILILDGDPYSIALHRFSYINASSIANGAWNEFSFPRVEIETMTRFRIILAQSDGRPGNELALMIWPQADQDPHLTVQSKFQRDTQSGDGYPPLAIALYETHEAERVTAALPSIALLFAASVVSAILCVRKPERFNELVAVLCLLSAFYWIYFHSLSQGTYLFQDYRQGAYYKTLALQIEKGSLGVPGGPTADWAYYKGTSYLYFGPLPALIWLALKKVIELPPTFSELTLICSIVNLAAFYVLIRDIAEHFNLGLGETLWHRLLFFVLYGLGPLYFLAARYFVYETSIVFGSTFLISSTILFLRYWNEPNLAGGRKSLLLFLSGSCLALAFASRINLLICLLPLPLLVALRESDGLKRPRPWRIFAQRTWPPLAYLLVPVICVMSAYGLYNMARFDSALEFGHRYMQVGNPVELARAAEYGYLSIVYVWRNVYHITLLAPQISLQPPFIHYAYPEWLVGNDYPRLVNLEYCSSVFFSSPLLLFMFGTSAYFANRTQRANILILSMVGALAASATLLMDGYARRYLEDYYAYLVVLSFLGFVNLWRSSRSKWPQKTHAAFLLLTALALLWTFGLAFDLNVQFAFHSDFSRALSIRNAYTSFVPLSYCSYHGIVSSRRVKLRDAYETCRGISS